MAKSGWERAGDLAQLAAAIRDIIKAAIKGGFQAAALQALKHWWPYILVISFVLVMLPIIFFCSLPAILFGFGSSNDPTIQEMNAQAETARGYYERYSDYCSERVKWIEDNAVDSVKLETGVTNSEEEENPEVEYTTVIEGTPMDENWFIALHAVRMQNSLERMTEESIREFVDLSIPYTVTIFPPEESDQKEETTPGTVQGTGTTKPSGAESGEDDSQTSETEENGKEEASGVITITYLTPDQFMDIYEYSETDRNWVSAMIKGLLGETGTDFGTLFLDIDWRAHVTSGFGYRSDPSTGQKKLHKGIDIKMPEGTGISAVSSGTVSYADYTPSYGYHIIIDHGDGLQTLYAHCSELIVRKGQSIKKGDVIAKVGSTGDSTGAHCHFEVRVGGQAVDPQNYLP